jgi:hypothetical protein
LSTTMKGEELDADHWHPDGAVTASVPCFNSAL